MEMMRIWIMQIAGIIVLGSICDAIMAEGEMKKYVRLVVGLVLTFAVIKPVLNISTEKLTIEFPRTAQSKAVEYKDSLEKKEQQNVMRIYRQKLEQKAQDYLLKSRGIDARVQVEVEEKNSLSFGNLKLILVEFNENSGASAGDVKKDLSENFGIASENVRIRLR